MFLKSQCNTLSALEMQRSVLLDEAMCYTEKIWWLPGGKASMSKLLSDNVNMFRFGGIGMILFLLVIPNLK